MKLTFHLLRAHTSRSKVFHITAEPIITRLLFAVNERFNNILDNCIKHGLEKRTKMPSNKNGHSRVFVARTDTHINGWSTFAPLQTEDVAKRKINTMVLHHTNWCHVIWAQSQKRNKNGRNAYHFYFVCAAFSRLFLGTAVDISISKDIWSNMDCECLCRSQHFLCDHAAKWCKIRGKIGMHATQSNHVIRQALETGKNSWNSFCARKVQIN